MNKKNEGCRPVRIHVAMEKTNPIRGAIEQVFGVLEGPKTHQFVDATAEADLIVFTEVRKIEKEYSDSKVYAFLDGAIDFKQTLPNGVTRLSPDNSVTSLAELIRKTWLELKPLELPKVESVRPDVQLRPDAKRILVIEDTLKHQASAKADLADQRLTIAGGYEEAMEVLAREKFDIVLTDLLMPMSSRTLSPDAFKLGELVHYGLFLMVEAAHQGAKHVAIVTDLNHHANWASAAFDHFRYPMQIEGAKVMMMHAPMRKGEGEEWVKDWATALQNLLN